MGKDLKDTLLNLMEASVEIMGIATDLYSGKLPATKGNLEPLKEQARKISREAQQLP